MENPMKEFKEEQKSLARKIKSDRKEGEKDQYDSYIFRHNHIVYCELRGRKREQIENPREGNEPSKFQLIIIRKFWENKLQDWRDYEETVRNSN